MQKLKLNLFVGAALHVLYRVCFVAAAWVFGGWKVAIPVAFIPGLSLFAWLGRVQSAMRRVSGARGRKLQDEKEVRRTCDERRKGGRGVLWGKMRIADRDATNHFCVVGAVGSGKTLTIRMLLRDQLPLLQPRSDRRALIYDPKQDMVQVIASALTGTDKHCPIWILNPFDERGSAWNIALDVQTPAAARQLADTLVPPSDNESQPFFSNAVRELLAAVVTVFVRTRPNTWTLRDVLLVMRSRELLRAVLEPHSFTQHVAKSFLDAGEVTVGSILATVATKLGPFEPVAAAWEKVQRKVSIQQWLHKDTSAILILGNDERMRSVLDILNQLFVALAAQQALTQEESDTRRTWFVFDEFSEAGRLRGLESIILRGRSKGCCVVLGFQDISHVHEVYGENLGNTLIGQCGNKAFLRIESPSTAKWASESIGELEQDEVNLSTTNASGTTSHTASEQRQLRATVLPSQLMDLPTFGDGVGLHGYYLIRAAGAYAATYPEQDVIKLIGPPRTDQQPFVAAPVDWQYLVPWSQKDAERRDIKPAQATTAHNGASQKTSTKAAPSNSLDDFERMIG